MKNLNQPFITDNSFPAEMRNLAKDTISKNDHYVLSGREVRELFSVLDNGFVPNKRLQEAMTIAEQIEKNGALNAGF